MASCEGDGYNQAIITRNSVSNSVSLTSPTDQNVITIQNTSTFASIPNKTQLVMSFISSGTAGAKGVIFKLIRNATFGTTLTYTAINTNTSVVQYSTTTTSATGGKPIFSFAVPVNGGSQLLLDSLNIIVVPGETLTLQATSGNNVVDASLCWEELW
jgi:hypothetical protein